MNICVIKLIPGYDVPQNRKKLFTALKVDQHMIVWFNFSVTLFSFCMEFEKEADTQKLIES